MYAEVNKKTAEATSPLATSIPVVYGFNNKSHLNHGILLRVQTVKNQIYKII
jgi:hypothetical protein